MLLKGPGNQYYTYIFDLYSCIHVCIYKHVHTQALPPPPPSLVSYLVPAAAARAGVLEVGGAHPAKRVAVAQIVQPVHRALLWYFIVVVVVVGGLFIYLGGLMGGEGLDWLGEMDGGM